MNEFKSCPFCGSKEDPEHWDADCNNGYVECVDCSAHVEAGMKKTTAANVWNSRPALWVDIKKETPTKADDYNQKDFPVFLVTNGKTVFMASWVSGLEMFGASDGMYSTVTHWMPAPKLPEGS